MITVKIKTVHGNIEVFETKSYIVCKRKDLHPDILTVDVYAGSRRVCHMRRRLQWIYRKFLYRPVVEEIKPEEEVKEEN